MWKVDFQFLTLLLVKLRIILAPNSLDKLIQLNSMEPRIFDLDKGEITDLKKFLKKPHSVVLRWCKLIIHKFKNSLSLFGHVFCANVNWWQDFTTLAIGDFFLPLLLNAKFPIFAVGFFVKPAALTKDPKWAPFAK